MSEPAGEPSYPRFQRIVCGIDHTAISREAARQAIAIGERDATLWGVSAWDPGEAMLAGINAAEVTDALRRDAVAALRHAEREIPGLRPTPIQGAVVAGMLAAIEDARADLVAVGAHGKARFAPLIGSMTASMANHAPCSVLIARRAAADGFPRRILHATDGSAGSLDAARTAGHIAALTGAQVVTLHVGSGLERAEELAAESVALLEECGREPLPETREGSPHRRIVEVAGTMGASLITIGSRGLTGLRALGSVSERVARLAPCSVLIARRAAHPVVEPGSADGEPSATTTEADSTPRTDESAP